MPNYQDKKEVEEYIRILWSIGNSTQKSRPFDKEVMNDIRKQKSTDKEAIEILNNVDTLRKKAVSELYKGIMEIEVQYPISEQKLRFIAALYNAIVLLLFIMQ